MKYTWSPEPTIHTHLPVLQVLLRRFAQTIVAGVGRLVFLSFVIGALHDRKGTSMMVWISTMTVLTVRIAIAMVKIILMYKDNSVDR